ncbi:MAG: N-acetylneuraminate synthase family protein [Phycisphaeraceae bacterium]|nr:N-acetylneuraminate synthase family protein [Phycisphaeraceae bacterium]MBX3366735.1 N-acetylneuraminate synthase family protein [Phycisphaeraceae bacterium]
MQIGTRDISAANPPYIIAEIGVNHDGSLDRALELTDAAADAGADAIKLQLFEADRLMSAAAKLAAYQKAAGESDPVDMLRRLELSIPDMARIVELAHARSIHAIVTVFSTELVDAAESLPWDAYKTASPDIVHRPLLERLVATGKPLIISTGASTIDEVSRALSWLTARDAAVPSRTALLQCVSSYPTAIEHAELGGILALAEIFDGPIGYSDHTQGVGTGAIAVGLGARILEKHFTYDTNAPGPDHAASLEPRDFARYVELARDAALAAATDNRKSQFEGIEPVKRVIAIEEDVRKLSRQSVVTTRSLPAGHVLSARDLTVKRPGTGVPAFEFATMIGKRLKRDVAGDVPLTPIDLTLG